jgi:hypothetical protein
MLFLPGMIMKVYHKKEEEVHHRDTEKEEKRKSLRKKRELVQRFAKIIKKMV